MKSKLIAITLLILIIIPITGCNNNTKSLTCTAKSNQDGRATSSKLKVKVKDNKIKDMSLTLYVTIPKTEQSYKEMLISQMRQKTDKISETKNGIKAVFNMDSEYFNSLGVSKDASYSEIKQVLELQGYVCEN